MVGKVLFRPFTKDN
jgi:hypothetical protein